MFDIIEADVKLARCHLDMLNIGPYLHKPSWSPVVFLKSESY